MRHIAGVPSRWLMLAWDSMIVTGQSELTATLCRRTSSASPSVRSVIPSLLMP